MRYDVIIIGAGPAGLSAGLYASRATLNTLIIEKAVVGGQITTTTEIENYPGASEVTGPELVEKMKSKELTSEEITRAYAKKIDEKENDIKAFVTINKEDAIEKAKEIDKKIEKAYLDGRYGAIPIFDSIFFPPDDDDNE